MAGAVTVTRKGTSRLIVTFSALPGRSFGPWGMAETIRDLQVSALLSGLEARDLVLTALSDGTATVAL